jgi:RHS repeat-associated protein
MTLHYNWHRVATRVAVYRPTYGERGVLTSENLLIGAARTPNGPTGGINAGGPDAIQEIRYNVKGQKELVKLGNGTTTTYEYDPTTFRLTRILTRRRLPPGDTCSSAFNNASVIQDLQYTYDPVGNITQIVDAAQATRYGANQRIDPINRYEYDPLYRLTSATGKESGAASGPPTNVEGKVPEAPCPAPDPAALRNYIQLYTYDPVGNIKRMRHVAGDTGSWTRDYSYAYEDAGAPPSNRLATMTGRAGVVTTYRHDTHGNMLNLANAPAQFDLLWDHRDMIRKINLGGGGIAYYQYDAAKQRVRKRIENQNGLGGYWERIYLGGYELYRRYNGAGTNPIEEIETHHLFEGDQRVLIVDDVITASNHAHPRPDGLTVRRQTLFRYQYTNHLGSACLEADNASSLISYEEYHPYGTSAYRAVKSGVEAPPRRYRYTGMERDDESGLNYHTTRYCATWLGRWISPDSISIAGGLNVYSYAANNPSTTLDPGGTQPIVVPGSGQKFTDRTPTGEVLPGGVTQAPLEPPPTQVVPPVESGISIDAAHHQGALLKDVYLQARIEQEVKDYFKRPLSERMQDDFEVAKQEAAAESGPRLLAPEAPDPLAGIPHANALKQGLMMPGVAAVTYAIAGATATGALLAAYDGLSLGTAINQRDYLSVGIQLGLTAVGFSLGQGSLKDPLPPGVKPYQLELFPTWAYERGVHYGGHMPFKPLLARVLGQWWDHTPPLVQHYYEGPGGGRLAGFNLTQGEREFFARSWSLHRWASPAFQRRQGKEMSVYSVSINESLSLVKQSKFNAVLSSIVFREMYPAPPRPPRINLLR